MSIGTRILGTLVVGFAFLVAAAVVVSLLIWFALWLDDLHHRRVVRRDQRLEDERIRALAEAGWRDFEALLSSHGHEPN